MNASSEFVGSKSLELDIYGLTVLSVKKLLTLLLTLWINPTPIYKKTIKGIYPEVKTLLESYILFFPFETHLGRKIDPGTLRNWASQEFTCKISFHLKTRLSHVSFEICLLSYILCYIRNSHISKGKAKCAQVWCRILSQYDLALTQYGLLSWLCLKHSIFVIQESPL